MTLTARLVAILSLSILSLSGVTSGFLRAQTADPGAGARELVITEGWALARGERSRARPSIPIDPLEWAWLEGKLRLPDRGAAESPSAPDLADWKKVAPDDGGRFDGRTLTGGWLATYVDVPSDGIWLLDAQGHGSVRVNGVLRAGDVYANGRLEIPVALRAGANSLIFASGRGAIGAKLRRPARDVFFSARDSTFPHVIRGESEPLWGAILVVNATAETRVGWRLTASGPGFRPTETAVSELPPLSVRKVAFRIDPAEGGGDAWAADAVEIALALSDGTNTQADTTTVKWSVRGPDQTHVRTFRSRIEGAVQYYGVVPPAPGTLTAGPAPGLILSLHGAGVEAEGQAGVYQARPNTYVITPTNRRNFGFDWEDWGRWDALEVLEIARTRFKTEPRRTWLTGHSMGGHGTWHIGSLFPDRFAALGPSAGWISFSTYAGRGPEPPNDPLSVMIRRPMAVSDTLARSRNLQYPGVFILHGDADDNVPVDQARRMREELSKFHPDFVYKEQPGAGHWWGNICCDYPAMMRFFEDREIPAAHTVPAVRFITPNPAASADCFWAGVHSQLHQGELSEIDLRFKTDPPTATGTTKNVHRLVLRTQQLRAPDAAPISRLAVDIDGSRFDAPPAAPDAAVHLERTADGWRVTGEPDPADKSPQRGGGFKSAFQNRFLFVYGTAGTPEENAWMLERARFDAEVFRYRGNGSADVVPDTRWREAAAGDRNVIVFGNATLNSAWAELLGDCPIQVARDQWQAPGREPSKASASVLMVRPRPGSTTALVGAIGGTTLQALKASDRLPIYSSGTGYPDVVITSPEFLSTGTAAVQLTGYFGHNWSFETGEWVGPGK